jgi:hypothetical protein
MGEVGPKLWIGNCAVRGDWSSNGLFICYRRVRAYNIIHTIRIGRFTLWEVIPVSTFEPAPGLIPLLMIVGELTVEKLELYSISCDDLYA